MTNKKLTNFSEIEIVHTTQLITKT